MTSVSDDELIEDTEFTCPTCGAHEFGSTFVRTISDVGGIEHMVGHCHGPGCDFTWDRADDGKYFRGTGTYRPSVLVGSDDLTSAG